MGIEEVGKIIIGSAIEVHKTLGPGLLESCYEKCLAYEIAQAGLKVECEKTLPISYKDKNFEQGFRIDLIVEEQIIVELKSVDSLSDVYLAQVLTYLKLSDIKVGYLINFNVPLLKDGIKRVVNNL